LSIITVYQLSSKFVNRQEDIPEGAQQVVYYALAVGHHVGVMDCFSALADIPLDEYRAWVERLPDGEARRKLEGAWKWGEIEINRSHVNLLLSALEDGRADSAPWAPLLAEGLRAILLEPAYYLMLRRRN
jgi:hydrogenase-4 component J